MDIGSTEKRLSQAQARALFWTLQLERASLLKRQLAESEALVKRLNVLRRNCPHLRRSSPQGNGRVPVCLDCYATL